VPASAGMPWAARPAIRAGLSDAAGAAAPILPLQPTMTSDPLVTSEAIIVEVVRILSLPTHYNLPREQAAAIVATLLGLPGLELPNKSIYLRALELWADSTVDFVDTLSVAHMEHQAIATIASFDRDFDRFPQIARRVP
jgi:predicted nucleic-acid-binding protein